MKYKVKLELPDNHRSTYYKILDDTTSWLIENFGNRLPWSYTIKSGMVFEFRYEEDAMAFKLRWT